MKQSRVRAGGRLAAHWIAVAGLLLSACGGNATQQASTSGPIIIGQAIALSGFLASYDGPPVKGLELWANKTNAAGGLNGRQIKFVTADTKTDINLGASAADNVLDQGANILVVSCDFDYGGPAALQAQKRGIIAFSVCAGSLKFGPSGIGDLAFTMGETAPGFGAGMAEWAYQDKGWKNAYLLLDPTVDFTKQESTGFTDRLSHLGGKLVGRDTFQQTDQSIATQITRLRATSPQPDYIYLSSYGAGQDLALRQIRAAGIDLPVVSDGGFDGEVWKKAVPNATNLYFNTYASIYGDDPRPGINEFFNSYRAAAGEPSTSYAILGYAMGQALQVAITRAGGSTKGPDVAAQLVKFKGESTIMGPQTFTPTIHADLKRPMAVLQVQGGKTSFLKIWTPQEVPLVQT